MLKHKHHIIPKHQGGSDDPSNLVELTVEEHALAHKLLYEQYGKWEDILIKYANWKDHKTNKKAHIIWQRYASSVWDDIDGRNVLPFRDSKEEDDEKHVHALQLDVIDRLVELYSNPGETVLTPFMGVGSEVYSPVSLGRKAIGVELKDSYYKQAIINIGLAGQRFGEEQTQGDLLAGAA
jgi:DNA modification methylase